MAGSSSTHSQLLEGEMRAGRQRIHVQMIEQPPGSAATPSVGRAVTLSVDSTDNMAALSQRIAEVLGAASGSEVGLPRIYHNNAELTDTEHLERTVAQIAIPPESAPAAPRLVAPLHHPPPPGTAAAKAQPAAYRAVKPLAPPWHPCNAPRACLRYSARAANHGGRG